MLNWLKKLFLTDYNYPKSNKNFSVNFSEEDIFDDDCDTTDPSSPCYDDPFDNFYDDYDTDNTICDPFNPTDPCYWDDY